ncbi:hypothetical protein ACRE_087620 [Hapsidospora chrysogenum ATCC 11550]|uniref:Uncharacterized protein n=1 Tax=Hapsidospora chrysogenum (strain ATCC 11550 / CBS 779.69 / DSM 880 / IAM 14645 / JCM 23072 / IMI 49137) TaxID=857340 RepID=A0A086STW3_HAPC1|nr:hypothetical protein ACRE_087620 [Hapsidospora chrysogenum ATCC 11550]
MARRPPTVPTNDPWMIPPLDVGSGEAAVQAFLRGKVEARMLLTNLLLPWVSSIEVKPGASWAIALYYGMKRAKARFHKAHARA